MLCDTGWAGQAQCTRAAGPAVLRLPLGTACRTGAAQSSVQVPEERQGDVLRQEDHEEGNSLRAPSSLRGVGFSLCLGPCRALGLGEGLGQAQHLEGK